MNPTNAVSHCCDYIIYQDGAVDFFRLNCKGDVDCSPKEYWYVGCRPSVVDLLCTCEFLEYPKNDCLFYDRCKPVVHDTSYYSRNFGILLYAAQRRSLGNVAAVTILLSLLIMGSSTGDKCCTVSELEQFLYLCPLRSAEWQKHISCHAVIERANFSGFVKLMALYEL